MTSRLERRAEFSRRRWFAVAFVAGFATTEARAQAADPVELTWHAPEGCPSAENIQARIRKLVGPAQSGGTPPQAEATVRQTAGRFHLKLVVRSGSLVGERNIEGKSCEDLAGATAVNLALLLRSASPLGAAELPNAQPPGQASPLDAPETPSSGSAEAASGSAEPTAASSEPAAQPESEPSSSESPVRGVLQIPLVALGIGPLPQPSYGAALGGGVWVERWLFLAEATAWLRQDLRASTPVAIGAQVDRVELGLRTCLTFPFGRVEIAPCIAASLVHVWARGTGAYVAARTDESTWFAGSAGAQARLRLAEWLSLVGGADVQIQAASPEISIDAAGPVGQLGPAALKITLGSEWIF